MHSVHTDNSLFSWAVLGRAQSERLLGHGDTPHDQMLELIDQYQIYTERPSDWFKLETEEAWFGQALNLCGTHPIVWPDSERISACENLTRLLQAIAASEMPLEHDSCRHEIGACTSRVIRASSGSVCHHSLSIEISHPFHTATDQRQMEHKCFAELERRLACSGIPQVAGAFDPI